MGHADKSRSRRDRSANSRVPLLGHSHARKIRERSPPCQRTGRENTLPRLGRTKDFAGFFAIHRDLCLQGIETGKALLRPQPLDQSNAQMLAIEIAAEIEQMRFESKVLAA